MASEPVVGHDRETRTATTGSSPRALAGSGWAPARVLNYHYVMWRRFWTGAVFSMFLSPVLFLVAMGYGLGSLVGHGGRLVDGVSYLAFVAPGVMAGTAMQAAIQQSTWQVLSAIKWQRQYHAMLATPLGVSDVVLGHLLHVVFVAGVPVAVFLAIAAVVGAIPSAWGLLAIVAAVLTALAFAATVFGYSTYLHNDAGFNLLFRIGMVPLFLFSGTFFPIQQLPVGLRWLAEAAPLWHGVALARNSTLGRLHVATDLGHAAYLLLWIVAGTLCAVHGLRRRMVV